MHPVSLGMAGMICNFDLEAAIGGEEQITQLPKPVKALMGHRFVLGLA